MGVRRFRTGSVSIRLTRADTTMDAGRPARTSTAEWFDSLAASTTCLRRAPSIILDAEQSPSSSPKTIVRCAASSSSPSAPRRPVAAFEREREDGPVPRGSRGGRVSPDRRGRTRPRAPPSGKRRATDAPESEGRGGGRTRIEGDRSPPPGESRKQEDATPFRSPMRTTSPRDNIWHDDPKKTGGRRLPPTGDPLRPKDGRGGFRRASQEQAVARAWQRGRDVRVDDNVAGGRRKRRYADAMLRRRRAHDREAGTRGGRGPCRARARMRHRNSQ